MRSTWIAILLSLTFGLAASSAADRQMTDALARVVTIPDRVTRVVCSGPGSLRLLVYLGAADMAVAVDDIELRQASFDARPYALAHPEFRERPVFGDSRGKDNPERIMTLDPAPQIILKTQFTSGYDPNALQEKTGIPVIAVQLGDLGKGRASFDQALRLFGQAIGLEERAETVIRFFDERIGDLQRRSAGRRTPVPTAYVGGIAFAGPHGFQSTEPRYPPFAFVGVKNVAAENAGPQAVSNVAKEKILEWDPEFLFVDLSSEQLGETNSAIASLKSDPAYRTLSAIRRGRTYGLLPYNWYAQNSGSILANAYFIGKLTNPAGFADIDPKAEADRIYTFLVGKPMFGELDRMFNGKVYVELGLQ